MAFLQDPGHRVVVFGSDKKQRIGSSNLCSEPLDGGREAEGAHVFVIKRDRTDIGGLDRHSRRFHVDRGLERCFVVRTGTQAAANAENGNPSLLAHAFLPYGSHLFQALSRGIKRVAFSRCIAVSFSADNPLLSNSATCKVVGR